MFFYKAVKNFAGSAGRFTQYVFLVSEITQSHLGTSEEGMLPAAYEYQLV